MSRIPKSANPCYGLLVVVGVLFALTACAYFVMALRGADPSLEPSPHGLMALLDQHGLAIMVVELVLLGLATVGAMSTDTYWTRQASHTGKEQQDEGESLRRD